MATTRAGMRALAACLVACAVPLAAAGQDTGPSSAQNQQGPMVVERVQNGFAIAPDFKVTKLNGSSARLAGAYGGWVIDNTLLVGAGGYLMTNRSSAFDMRYGGAVVEWLQPTDRAIGFSLKGLVGIGQARLSGTTLDYFPMTQPFGRFEREVMPTRTPGSVRVVFDQDFFIFEPQADLLVNLPHRLRLHGGVGYRVIGGAEGMESRLRGVTGSVALQIGGSSARRQ